MAKTPAMPQTIPNTSTVPGVTLQDALNNLGASMTGAVNYKGLWDAQTNVPVLGNGGSGGDQGDYYRCSVPFNRTIDGNGDWRVGDCIVHNGSTWDKWDHTDAVQSVNGQTDVVVLAPGDIGAEPAIGAKGSAFNKNFGSAAGDVCQGNDGRLSDARVPLTHGSDKHSASYDPAGAASGAVGSHESSYDHTKLHTQGTDQKLDNGGANEVAASAIKGHIGSTSNPHSVTKAQVSLTNVTDDAQLKRSAGDIVSFTEKTVPISADHLLIEDSADANNKKKVTLGNLLGMKKMAALGFNAGTGSIAAATTKYIGQGGMTLTEADHQQSAPFTGTVIHLAVRVNTNTSINASTFAVRKNGGSPGMTLSIGAGAAGTFSITGGLMAVTIGDGISIEIARPAGTGSMSQVSASIYMEG